MKLNLCCSDSHLPPPFVNVDRVQPADVIVDLNLAPWSWADNSVEEIIAHDALEHLFNPIISLNECWRILKPGGKLDLIVPTAEGRGAFQDPTHLVYPPFTLNSLFYYEHGNPHRERFGRAYGIRARFRIISQCADQLPDSVVKLCAILEAVKP